MCVFKGHFFTKNLSVQVTIRATLQLCKCVTCRGEISIKVHQITQKIFPFTRSGCKYLPLCKTCCNMFFRLCCYSLYALDCFTDFSVFFLIHQATQPKNESSQLQQSIPKKLQNIFIIFNWPKLPILQICGRHSFSEI